MKIALNVKDKDVRKASKKAKQRLSCKYSDYLFNDNFFRNSNTKVLYFTGFSSFGILKKLNDFLKKDMEETAISKSERTSIIDIGNCFLLSRATASKVLLDALKVLYVKLNQGCRALYQCVFVPDMVPKVLTVIDCFETFIDRPSTLTWPSFEH